MKRSVEKSVKRSSADEAPPLSLLSQPEKMKISFVSQSDRQGSVTARGREKKKDVQRRSFYFNVRASNINEAASICSHCEESVHVIF